MDKTKYESRRKDFKKNFEDPRRRREDVNVQIRKAQREAQVSQKRTQAFQSSAGGAAPLPGPTMDIEQAYQCTMADDPQTRLTGTQQFRRLLAVDQHPPIQEVVNTGIVPRLIIFLKDHSQPALQLEAAWTLTNIASGTTEQTKVVTDHNAIPIFVELLASPKEEVRDQAVWALGNVAGDCADLRDLVLQANALQPLLRQIKEEKKSSLLRNATWAFSNLCRGSPGVNFNLVRPGLPVLRELIYSLDIEVLTDACWALSYLLDTRDSKQIDEIIHAGVASRLVELLTHPNSLVQNPALRSIGQIIAGTHEQTEVMILAGVLQPLTKLLSSSKVPIKKESCWVLSNIAAGTANQIQALIAHDIIEVLVQLLSTAELEVRREAAWALSNAVIGGTSQQIEHIVRCGCIKPLCDLLAVKDKNIVQVSLEAIDNILRVGQEIKEAQGKPENPYVLIVEEAEGFSKLERLQYRDPNSDIYKAVVRIITSYFPLDEEFQDEDDKPIMAGGSQQQLAADSSELGGFGVSVPQGGFDFGAR